MTEDLYAVLGVAADATPDEIRQRFRFLSHAFHPDKFATDAQRRVAEQEFKRITAAYQLLSDSTGRSRYDASRSSYSRRRESPPNEKRSAKRNHKVSVYDGTTYIGEIRDAKLTYEDEPLLFANIKRIDQSEPCGCGDPACTDAHGSGTIYLADGTELRIHNWRAREGLFGSVTRSNFNGEFDIHCESMGRSSRIDIFDVVSVEPVTTA